MSNLSISTGNVLFSNKVKAQEQKVREKPQGAAPMHIALLADFSGRGSRQQVDLAGLASRKAYNVDRDNFEELFEKFQVSVKLPVSEAPLNFAEYDDLHPDFLIENLSLFADLRSLKRRLKKKEHFAAAAEEIQQWASFSAQKKDVQQQESQQAPKPDAASTPPGDMLDAILTQSESVLYQDSPVGNIDALIKDIVSPYVEAKADPRLPEFEAAVDQASAQTLRRILHAAAYQNIESAWRCVELLTRRLETDKQLKLHLIDVSEEEIRQDLASASDISESALYKLLVEQFQVSGATGYSLINVDLSLANSLEDVRLASALSLIGQQANAAVIAGASTSIAGCEDISTNEEGDEWHHPVSDEFLSAWQSMREQSAAKYLSLCAPRFLVRLPYGKRTSPIESFDFEELPETQAHNFYLWANSAYLVTYLLALSFKKYGWDFRAGQEQKVAELPLHIVTDEDGDSQAKACAEVFLRDRAVQKLAEMGLLSVRSVKNEASVLVPVFRSVAAQGAVLFE